MFPKKHTPSNRSIDLDSTIGVNTTSCSSCERISQLQDEINMLRRERCQTFAPQFEKLGYIDLFDENFGNERSVSKRDAISSTSSLYLIAHSGQAFFSRYGSRYLDLLIEVLECGGDVKAILTNPWSFSGLLLSVGENANIGNILSDTVDPISIIENSSWYNRKYLGTIEGYLWLKKQFPNRIDVRFTKFEVPASILITDDRCFFEPYVPVNLLSRNSRGSSTFELALSHSSNLYGLSKEYFSFLWSQSHGYNEINNNIENDKSNLLTYLKGKFS